MKKITKTLVTVVCLVALCLGAFALAACGGDEAKTGEAYGLVHGGGYVGRATITVKGDKVTDATLTEICFPTQVKKEDGSYYASVTYGEVTMTYDTEASTYKVGTQTIKEFFATEDNCKAYYKAVVGGKVKADGAEGIMTKAALCKDDNNYWTCDKNEDGTWNSHPSAPYSADAYSRWKWNRDATLKYVKENGVGNLLKLTKPGKDADNKQIYNGTDPYGNEVAYWMDGEVSTGATWNDFNTVKTGTLSYAQLITNAYNAAK